MDLMPSAEQDAIRDSVRSFLAERLPMSKVRELSSQDPHLEALDPIWREAGSLGFFGLGLAEKHGGAGYAISEEMVLFEELGRALAPGPWLGSVIAAHALAGSDQTNLRSAYAHILTGELRVALIEDPRGGRLSLAGDRLSGARMLVPGAPAAGGFLILDQTGVLYVPADAPAVSVAPVASLDVTNPVGTVSFHDAPCSVLTRDSATATALRCAATVLACAEAVGGIERTLTMSVEYAKVRHQFGKPIGSFQAVKHRCADMAVRAEIARSVTIYAALSVRDGTEDAEFQVAVAKALCGNAYLQSSADNVQNHGGMGFTWECDAHLYVKRARSFDQTLGSRSAQLDRLVAQFRAA